MNNKVYIFLGGILILIAMTVGLILVLNKKNAAVKTAVNSGTGSTISGNGIAGQNNSGNSGAGGTDSTTSGTDGAAGGTATNLSGTGTGANNTATNQTNTSVQPYKTSDSQVISPIFSYDNKSIWYFRPDGHLFKQNLSTGLKQEYILPNNIQTDNVIWPQAGNDFIVETDNATTKTFNYYNSQAKTFTAYPSNVKEVDFMPDGLHVLYEWVTTDGAQKTLSLANSDLTGHKTIMNMPDSDDVIKVAPTGNKAFFWKSGSPFDGKLYYVDLDKSQSFIIKTAGNNFGLWAPDGKRFVFAKLPAGGDPSSASLWLGDITSGPSSDQQLNFSTSMNKLVFDANASNLYVALTSSSGAGDTIWKVNLSTLQKNQIFPLPNNTTPISATNLLISSDGKLLFFKNSDGFLYSVTVPQASQ